MAYQTKSRGKQEEGKEKPPCLVVAAEGRRLMEEDKEALAEKRFRLALSMHPNDPEHLFDLSNAVQAQGRYEEALKQVCRAQKLDKGNPVFYGPMAHIFLRMEKYHEAITAATMYLLFRPGDSAALRDLAGAYYKTFQHVKALRTYKILLRSNPQDLDLLLSLGCCYGELGRPVKAIAVWRRCIQINPSDKEAMQNIRLAEAEMSAPRKRADFSVLSETTQTMIGAGS